MPGAVCRGAVLEQVASRMSGACTPTRTCTYVLHTFTCALCGALASARSRRSFWGHVCHRAQCPLAKIEGPFQICRIPTVAKLSVGRVRHTLRVDALRSRDRWPTFTPCKLPCGGSEIARMPDRIAQCQWHSRSSRAVRRLRADVRGAACSPDCPDCTNREHRPDRVHGRSSRLGAREGS